MIYNVDGESILMAYNIVGDETVPLYDIDGHEVHSSRSNIDYTNYSVQTWYVSSGLNNNQGLDVYDGYIFQFTTTDHLVVIKISDGSVVNNFYCKADHGDSAYFSTQFYAESDQFPLLYVSADTTPNIYVNRVTTSSATLVKTLKFSTGTVGYYPCGAYDERNQIMYMIGYTKEDYQTDQGGTNKTFVTKWDMSNLTQNGDGTYTPAFISSYERAFIYIMQGLRFQDGMIWITSGGYDSTESYIYALNPANGTILYTIDLNTTTEVEGLGFITDHQMLVGFQNGRYDLYTFSTLEGE